MTVTQFHDLFYTAMGVGIGYQHLAKLIQIGDSLGQTMWMSQFKFVKTTDERYTFYYPYKDGRN